MTLLPRPGPTVLEFLALVAVALVALLALAGPVQAYETYNVTGVTEWDVPAIEGMAISEIQIIQPGGLMPMGSPGDIALSLDNYGNVYGLYVNASNVADLYWTFDVTLVYPNGTTETKHLTKWGAAWDYRVDVQYSVPDLKHVDSYFTLSMYIGINPLTTQFNAIPPQANLAYVPFSEVSGNSTEPVNVDVYFVTPAEWQEIETANPVWGVGVFTGSLFSWTWDMILAFFNAIPYVGPYIATILEYTGLILGEILYWFKFFLIDNWEITILTVEFFIISHALLTTKSLWKLVQRILDDHIAIYEFLIKALKTMIDLVTWIVHLVTEIINAIQPV